MRYIVFHTLPEGVTCDDLDRIKRATQQDPNVKGVRSYINLTEHKAVCVVDAPDRQSLVSFFQKQQLPYDWILPVEHEAEGGRPVEALAGVQSEGDDLGDI